MLRSGQRHRVECRCGRSSHPQVASPLDHSIERWVRGCRGDARRQPGREQLRCWFFTNRQGAQSHPVVSARRSREAFAMCPGTLPRLAAVVGSFLCGVSAVDLCGGRDHCENVHWRGRQRAVAAGGARGGSTDVRTRPLAVPAHLADMHAFAGCECGPGDAADAGRPRDAARELPALPAHEHHEPRRAVVRSAGRQASAVDVRGGWQRTCCWVRCLLPGHRAAGCPRHRSAGPRGTQPDPQGLGHADVQARRSQSAVCNL
mmetsp:Transcript_33012/g.77871  ORF Transcript_33012/g.77871 Transcript_33012/m.77871 type:complete len:260 (+) Transcript_33012:1021-1800(+)